MYRKTVPTKVGVYRSIYKQTISPWYLGEGLRDTEESGLVARTGDAETQERQGSNVRHGPPEGRQIILQREGED